MPPPPRRRGDGDVVPRLNTPIGAMEGDVSCERVGAEWVRRGDDLGAEPLGRRSRYYYFVAAAVFVAVIAGGSAMISALHCTARGRLLHTVGTMSFAGLPLQPPPLPCVYVCVPVRYGSAGMESGSAGLDRQADRHWAGGVRNCVSGFGEWAVDCGHTTISNRSVRLFG